MGVKESSHPFKQKAKYLSQKSQGLLLLQQKWVQWPPSVPKECEKEILRLFSCHMGKETGEEG